MSRTRESFEATLKATSIDVGSLSLRPDGTLASEPAAEPPTLPPLPVTESSGELRLGAVIGEGGMGVVRAAEQRALGREVAVKALREEARTPGRVADFIREARVTGSLSHPNVVPIHGLGVAPDGAPLIIMKRVEGRSWRTHIEETFGRAEHLEVHLDTLLAVCRAVEMAHARGILHRDLKPDNVLVGPFGEVLVVDWGLAVRFRDDAEPAELPHCASLRSVVGTPRYMAPEMASGDGTRFGPHTDVYLLGATLHHVLTNQPRHDGPTLMTLLYHAFASEPFVYGGEVPAELGAIANRACAPDPADRFESVAALRRAILDYRAHSGSRRLATEARRRLDEGGDLSTCRFGFEQALAAWPGNEAARAGLRETLGVMVERALARDAIGEAEALLEELGQLSDADGLRARVSELRVDLDRRAARIEALEAEARDRDLGLSAGSRRTYGVAFGVLFLLYNAALGVLALAGPGPVGFFTYVAGAGAIAGLLGALAITRSPDLLPNQAGRRLFFGLAALLLAQAPVFFAVGWLGGSIEQALAVSLLQLAGSIAIKSLAVDPRTLWVAALSLALGALSLAVPPVSWFAVGVAYAAFFVFGSMLDF